MLFCAAFISGKNAWLRFGVLPARLFAIPVAGEQGQINNVVELLR
jgi:hypothetical protein